MPPPATAHSSAPAAGLPFPSPIYFRRPARYASESTASSARLSSATFCSARHHGTAASPHILLCIFLNIGTHHPHPVPADKHSEISEATRGFSTAQKVSIFRSVT